MTDFAGWMPVRVHQSVNGLRVDWCYLGDLRFTEPFFDQTIARCLRHPANVLFQHETSLAAWGELNVKSPGVPPAGFIFHMSRCGSTLVSQMLAALPENIVISEASPVDGILRAHFHDGKIAEEQRMEWLRWLLNAFGQRRHSAERRLFVKFDCWHTLFLPLIERAFPEVPWIFLYRDPVEVLVSHQTQPGRQMIPGVLEPALFGWDADKVSRMTPGEYRGRVLAAIGDAVLEQTRPGNGRLINYRQLPGVVTDELLEFFGIENSPDVTETMAGVSRFQAKNPMLPFEDDSAAKNGRATEEIREISRRWLDEIHRQLEARRLRS